MPQYNIADLTVDIKYRYDFAEKRAKDYLAKSVSEPDISLEATDSDFRYFIDTFHRDDCCHEFEYVILGDEFHRKILKFSGLMFHSSCVVVDGTAYLFSADSGTGKSTHTALWLKLFGERAFILNDDKPILRIVEDELFAYGSPFSGKTELNRNAKAKIGGICFIERAQQNSIEKITAKQALPLFMKQTYHNVKKEDLNTYLAVTDKVLSHTNLYILKCNMDIEAAKVAYEGMSGREAK